MDKKITIVTMFVTIILTLALLVGGIFLSRHLTAQAENNNIQEELPHEHDMTEWKIVLTPTCTEAGEEQRTCECGEIETREIAATGHNFRTLIEEGNECIGVTRHLKCEICSEEITMSSLGIGHTFDHPNIGGSDGERIPATCTSPAFNKATCARCGEVQLTIVEGSSALGHTFSEWEVVTHATCTEVGLEQRVCSRCGETETRAIAIVEHNYTDTVLQAATCSAEGIKERTCSDCGYVCQETIPIDSTKHTYEYETVVQATCTTAGQKKKICSVCGFEELISISPSHTYTTDYLNNRIVCSVCGHDSREITNNTRTLLTEGHSANGDITSSNMPDYYNISGCENGIRGFAEQAGLPSSSFNVFVPEVLYNRPVKEINNNAFSGVSGVKYIYVSDGITIAANAFANCRDLLYLSLPSTARGITFDFTGCPDTLQILYRD